jgi:hypothetical protein
VLVDGVIMEKWLPPPKPVAEKIAKEDEAIGTEKVDKDVFHPE